MINKSNLSSAQRLFDRIRQHRVFETLVITVIIAAALVIGAKSFHISYWARHILNILDFLISLFFFVELSIRFLGEKNKTNFLFNGWHLFDILVISFSLLPIENSSFIMVTRLVRVFRVLRMVSIIPELRMLVNSFIKALPQLGYLLLMMFVIFYIYAAAGSTLFAKINPQLWDDILLSLLTLFRVMTLEDWTDIMYETMKIYPWSWLYFCSFVCLTAFIFLNMIIGILINMMEKESRQKWLDQHADEPTIVDVSLQITQLQQQLNTLIEQQQNHTNSTT